MNTLFRDAYARARTAETSKGTAIVVNFGKMALMRDGSVLDEVGVSTPSFHTLKVFAHLPLGAYLATQNLGAAGTSTASAYADEVERALGASIAAPLSAEQKTRCKKIADETLAFLRSAASAAPDDKHVRAFARTLAPLMLANAEDAGVEWTRTMHEIVEKWKKVHSLSMADVRVLVRGPHQARRLHAAVQYFAAALGECGDGLSHPGESRRLVYAEWLPSDSAAYLDLPATVIVDAAASALFFDDPELLTTDVLAAGARKEIVRLGMRTLLPCAKPTKKR